jgi:hypothetical protein
MDLTPLICKALSPFAVFVSLAFPSLDKKLADKVLSERNLNLCPFQCQLAEWP